MGTADRGDGEGILAGVAPRLGNGSVPGNPCNLASVRRKGDESILTRLSQRSGGTDGRVGPSCRDGARNCEEVKTRCGMR